MSVVTKLLVGAMVGVSAHGSGAWMDPAHKSDDSPLAGMRYVSETEHVLKMVGTDDGSTWWSVDGYCTGEDMTNIHFDFSSKGGPANMVGKWARIQETYPSGLVADEWVTLTWPDGNVWRMQGSASDVKSGAVTVHTVR